MLEGRRACLFAYGQTGSGKTFSMLGAEGGKLSTQLDGVIPQACAEIFRRTMKMEKMGKRFELAVSFCEIYQEGVTDLLADPVRGAQPSLSLRQRGEEGFEVVGERLEPVHTAAQLHQLVELYHTVGTPHAVQLQQRCAAMLAVLEQSATAQ